MKHITKKTLAICLGIIVCLIIIAMTRGTGVADSSFTAPEKQDVERTDSICLNDIRFADFKNEDWLDNDYIRCLRKYLDDFNSGKIENEDLEPYKEKIQGKFVIADVEPSIWGGLRILFVFIDYPEYLFSAYVYSTVDVEKKKVVSYSVQYVSVTDNEYEMTKEEILDSLKVHLEFKLW